MSITIRFWTQRLDTKLLTNIMFLNMTLTLILKLLQYKEADNFDKTYRTLNVNHNPALKVWASFQISYPIYDFGKPEGIVLQIH